MKFLILFLSLYEMRYLVGTHILHSSLVKRKISDKHHHKKLMKFVKRGNILLNKKK